MTEIFPPGSSPRAEKHAAAAATWADQRYHWRVGCAGR